MNLLNSNDFWQFACQLYSEDGMQARLLNYQNQQGKNVNLCLLLYYLDSLGLQINNKQLDILIDSISEFDKNIMQPLRAVRSQIKANQATIRDYANIRTELLSAELKLEKQQQIILINVVNSMDLTACSTPNNSDKYFA